MKDRIRRLLETEKLSSSAFADIIGVQRSSISHILSGRNKPSLDFIEKLLNKFQNINSEWLILGKGAMYIEIRDSDLFTKSEADNIIKVPEVVTQTSEVTNVNSSDTPIRNAENEKLKEINKINRIVKIVNFYSDNTFEEFFPKRN